MSAFKKPIIVLAVLGLAACSRTVLFKSGVKERPPGPSAVAERQEAPPELQPPAPTKVSYQTLLNGVFKKSCVECHNAVVHKMDVDLTNYEAVVKGEHVVVNHPEESSLLEVMVNGSMPPRRRTDIARPTLEEIELVKNWIEQGAEP